MFCSLFASHLSSLTTSNKTDVFSEHLTEFLVRLYFMWWVHVVMWWVHVVM